MSNLVLRELTLEDEHAFFEGLKEWRPEELFWYTYNWEPGMSFSELITILGNIKNGINLPSHYVPGTSLYGFIDSHTIVGRVGVRHRLNDTLLRRGGHIGYSVAASYRQRGYASEMVRQALTYCRELGLARILITCASHNTASCKIIEKYRGVLENEFYDEIDQEMVKRYWIGL